MARSALTRANGSTSPLVSMPLAARATLLPPAPPALSRRLRSESTARWAVSFEPPYMMVVFAALASFLPDARSHVQSRAGSQPPVSNLMRKESCAGAMPVSAWSGCPWQPAWCENTPSLICIALERLQAEGSGAVPSPFL